MSPLIRPIAPLVQYYRLDGKLLVDLTRQRSLADPSAFVWQASARCWRRGDLPVGQGASDGEALFALAQILGYRSVGALLADAHLIEA